jgi:hypothetical protein
MYSDCERIRKDADESIARLKNDIKKQMMLERQPINNLIQRRNQLINLAATLLTRTLPHEGKMHSYYFQNRKDRIINSQKNLLGTLNQEMKQKGAIMDTLSYFRFGTTVTKPTSVSFPFWILKLEGRDQGEIDVITPTNLLGPVKLKKNQIDHSEFIKPFSKTLNKMRQKFQNDRFIQEGSQATLSRVEIQALTKYLDDLVKWGYIHEKYKKRIIKDINNPKKGGG